jgi:hypothetical protein
MKKLIKNIIYAITTLFFTANYAQVGINTTSPNAALDVVSTTNGMLLPRVALTTTTLAAPVVNPAGGALPASTLVYNTNTAGDVTPGYYYWSGSAWLRLNTGSGGSGGGWLLTGNNVTDANHFLGTTNWMSLKLKASNTLLGVFEPNGSVFFGVNASGSTNNAFAIGYGANSATSESYAFGSSAWANSWRSLALGSNTKTDGANSVAIGNFASTGVLAANSIAIGYYATTTANEAFAIGSKAHASGDNSVALGFNSVSSSSRTIALGSGTNASNTGATALGFGATSSGLYSTAIGYNATTSQNNAIVLGDASSTSTNVGVGTSSPNAKLHIVSSTASNGFQLQDGNQSLGKVLTSDANGKATWKNLGDDQAIGEILKASDSPLNADQIALGTSNVNINVSNYSNYIQVTKAGLYKVTYHVNLQKNATAGVVSGYFYLTNWGAEWANTRSYFSINTNENTSVSISKFINLSASQSISLYSSIGDSNVNVLANGTFISVEFVR